MNSEESWAPADQPVDTPADEGPPLPAFPVRVGKTFFSPGDLAGALARTPAWGLALVVGAVLILGQSLLIPAEIWDNAFREAMLSQGREMPAGFAGGSMMRNSALVAGPSMYSLMTFVFAGLITLIFAFILGDDGKYRQYLAVLTHAFLIPGIIGFALVRGLFFMGLTNDFGRLTGEGFGVR